MVLENERPVFVSKGIGKMPLERESDGVLIVLLADDSSFLLRLFVNDKLT